MDIRTEDNNTVMWFLIDNQDFPGMNSCLKVKGYSKYRSSIFVFKRGKPMDNKTIDNKIIDIRTLDNITADYNNSNKGKILRQFNFEWSLFHPIYFKMCWNIYCR